MKFKNILTLSSALMIQTSYAKSDDSFWYLKPTVGISQMSDQKGQTINLGSVDGQADISLDSGFTPGMAVGFNYGNGWAAEFAWEYRSNDSETTLADGSLFPDGNYASNVFFLNGYYHFDAIGQWRPYLGAGLMFSQEIDIDLEVDGVELSYTGDGDTGFQVMAGITYAINDAWSINGELRYGSFSSVDLSGEGVMGQINDLDYAPLTFGMGLQYNF